MRRNGSEGELKMANKLSKKWVPLHYSKPLPAELYFSKYSKGNYETALYFSTHNISLPIYHELLDNEVEYITNTILNSI